MYPWLRRWGWAFTRGQIFPDTVDASDPRSAVHQTLFAPAAHAQGVIPQRRILRSARLRVDTANVSCHRPIRRFFQGLSDSPETSRVPHPRLYLGIRHNFERARGRLSYSTMLHSPTSAQSHNDQATATVYTAVVQPGSGWSGMAQPGMVVGWLNTARKYQGSHFLAFHTHGTVPYCTFTE